MTPAFARLIGRLVGSRISPLLVDDVVGDLSEDFAVMRRDRGRIRAYWWLVFAVISLRRSQAPMTPIVRMSDFRVAARTLRARPAYAAVALLTITLVVGAGSAILAVISASFLRPLPFADEQSLMWLYSQPPGGTVRRNPMHSPTFLKMRDELRVLQDTAGIWSRERAVELTGAAETIDAASVSANLFHALGIEPAAGRMFSADEDRADAKVALVSDGFWRSRLGGGNVLGTPLKIDGEPFIVIGVLPPFAHNDFVDGEVFTPLAISGSNLPVPTSTLIRVFGRLPKGATLAQLQGDIDTTMANVVKERADVMNGWTASFIPVREGLFGDSRPALILLAAAILVLGAIASVNLANVTIAEISSRKGELSLRTALGASRGDLMRLMTTEHVILAVTGGIGGLLLARAVLPLILSLDPSVAASLGEVTIDWRVQIGAFALALTVGLLSGVIPTFLSTRGDLAHALTQAGRRTSGSRRQASVRAWLVGSETALAAVLLASSALLLGAFWNTVNISPGFDPTNVLGAQVRVPVAVYPGLAERAQFVKRVLEEIRAQPGVVGASATFNTFQGGGYNLSVTIDGHPTPDGRPTTMQFRRVAPGYFSLMKIGELKGRTFADSDDLNAQYVAVVSQSFVKSFLANEDPIGRRITRSTDLGHPLTIIGVVADVRDGGLTVEPGPTVYLCYGQNSNAAAPISLVVRTAGDPRTMERSVAEALHRVDASIPLTRPTTMTAFLRESLGPARFRSVLLALLSALGLVLSIVGIFGVTSRGVTERTRELGVRLALGSGRAELWGNVVRRAFSSVAFGLLAAAPLAFFASRLLAQWMPGVSEVPVWTLLPAWIVLALGGFAAAALPALRAARLHPIIALRAE